MQKFPGQEWNLHHSTDPSHSSDNTRSLTARPLGNKYVWSMVGWIRECQACRYRGQTLFIYLLSVLSYRFLFCSMIIHACPYLFDAYIVPDLTTGTLLSWPLHIWHVPTTDHLLPTTRICSWLILEFSLSWPYNQSFLQDILVTIMCNSI